MRLLLVKLVFSVVAGTRRLFECATNEQSDWSDTLQSVSNSPTFPGFASEWQWPL